MTLAPFPAAQCIDFAALLGQDRHEGPCSHMYPAAEAVVVAVVVAVTVAVGITEHQLRPSMQPPVRGLIAQSSSGALYCRRINARYGVVV